MMGTVLPFVRQVVNPNWMPNPDNWMWTTPENTRQGFGRTWRAQPGLANLLWLALDMNTPPRLFDARQHQLYCLLLMYGAPGVGVLRELVELAELQPLRPFVQRLKAKPAMADIPRYKLAPLLTTLAEGRLLRAHP
jgi:hypothetical protein